jgi:hypothetical protein
MAMVKIDAIVSRDLAGYCVERWHELSHWWYESGRGHDSAVVGYFSSEEAAKSHPDKPRHGSSEATRVVHVLTMDGKEGFLLDPAHGYRMVTRLD